MSVIKMFNNGTGVTVVSTQIDIPADGVIRSIAMGMQFEDASPATGEGAQVELSFLSVNTFAVNDARGSLCTVNHVVVFADAARIVMSGTPFCILTPIAVSVAAGERIFMHGVGDSVSATWLATAYLFVDDGIDVARAQVRRR